jgi:hypothetical protein
VACDLILCLLLLKEKEDFSEAATLCFGNIASERSLLSFSFGSSAGRADGGRERLAARD